MPKSKEILNRWKNRLLDFGHRLLRGSTGGKSSTGGLIEQSEICDGVNRFGKTMVEDPKSGRKRRDIFLPDLAMPSHLAG